MAYCICFATSDNFLAFSPTLSTLKQEPQTEQIKPSAKISLDNAAGSPAVAIGKLDEAQNSPLQVIPQSKESSAGNTKHDVNSGLACGCGSPQGSPLANNDYELNDKGSVLPQQQLSVLDPAKIEIVSANGAANAEDHK